MTAERALSAQKVNAKDAAPAEVEIPKEEASKLNRKIWALVLQYKAWLLVALSGAIIFGSIFPLWGLILAKTQTLFYYTDTSRIRSSATNVAIYFILLGTFSGNFNLGLSFLVGVACLVGGILQYGGVAQVGERVSMQLRGASPLCSSQIPDNNLAGFLFESLMRREIAFFDRDENAIGALTTRLSDDSRMVSKGEKNSSWSGVDTNG